MLHSISCYNNNSITIRWVKTSVISSTGIIDNIVFNDIIKLGKHINLFYLYILIYVPTELLCHFIV